MYLVRTSYVLCKHLVPDIYPVSTSTYLVSTCLFSVLLFVFTNNSLCLDLFVFNNLFFFHPAFSPLCSRDPEHDPDQQLSVQSLHNHAKLRQHQLHHHCHQTEQRAHMSDKKLLL